MGTLGHFILVAELGLKRIKDFLTTNAFGGGDFAQDGIEGSDPKGLVIRNRHTVVPGRFSLQNDVAAYLVNLLVLPLGAQYASQIPPQ
jgi:hypothetical protein